MHAHYMQKGTLDLKLVPFLAQHANAGSYVQFVFENKTF